MGHRGAAGLELENTEASLRRAIALGVDNIEIDVRKTKDNQLVLCHDDDLSRVANEPTKIKDTPLKQLQVIRLNNGSRLLSLSQALTIIGSTPVMIELKDEVTARILQNVLHDFPKANISIASFKLRELAVLKDLGVPFLLYGLEQTKPFDALHLARIFELDGVGLNFWLLNPLTYVRARLLGLDLYVYTVNHRYNAWFIRLFYPGVTICTDYPDRFVRPKRRLGGRSK